MKWAAVYLVSILGALTSTVTAQSPKDQEVQVGQHVVFSYPGEDPPDHLFDLIGQGKVGGIIIFGENVSDKLPDYIDRFQSIYRDSAAYLGTPLLIMTDQEGGKVSRLPGGPEKSAKEIGEHPHFESEAGIAGTSAAEALLEYNLNVNLAPVVDVYYEAGDGYGRSYGGNETLVGKCAYQFIKSQQGSHSVLATAKHFPGLDGGGPDKNTDERPVTINTTLDTLRSVHEAPYVKAIKAGVSLVMTSWAVYPALDDKPAGLSSRWIEELRTRLGFKGAIITDGIEAGALEAYGNHDHRAVLATQAGADIILAAARNVTQGESIVAAISAALDDGTLSRDGLAASSKRVHAVRFKV